MTSQLQADAPATGAAIGPHLPHLRRYARALSGSQQRGDQYVRAALESLLEAPELLLPAAPARISLFRLFHRYWDPVNHEQQRSGGQDRTGREALLLSVVEGFDLEEVADILNISAADVAADIEQARADIAAQIRSRVLVVEDEPVIAMHISQIVEDMGHEVVGTAMTRSEAIAEAQRVQPDLVLADIQLADGSSGMEAAADIVAAIDVPVVFITAYPERLLTGERAEPTFLVTKPFEPDQLVATVGHALLARRAFPEMV